MNLRVHLLVNIVAAGLLCLLVSIALVLVNSERQTRTLVENTSASLQKQLQYQLTINNAGYRSNQPFPDFDLWKQTSNTPGMCIRYEAAENGMNRSLCNGVDLPAVSRPKSFDRLYQSLFNPEIAITQFINLNGHTYGALSVSSSPDMAIAHAWDNVRNLLGLSALSILSVCLLVYLVINRALNPAQQIVAGLEQMANGNLSHRLPAFEVSEWRQTAVAINQLAATQQHLLVERQKLAVMLMNLQEEERRYLARELHDEFGQYLAAINAVATLIEQTATRECPQLVTSAAQIGRFTLAMQQSVQRLLTHLRPAELDELGLVTSLQTLVNKWNGLEAGKSSYRLEINGNYPPLSEVLMITVYRIIQEALSNIAKHAQASQAVITLLFSDTAVSITIKDNGKAERLPSVAGPGIGLLGIRERVTALDGKFSMTIAEPQGLILDVWLPLTATVSAE